MVARRVPPIWLVGLTVTATLAAIASLLLPWVRLGAASYSTIDLIGAAGALDLISGATRVAVVGTWFAIPILGAGLLFSLAAGRRSVAAAVSIVICITVLIPVVLLGTTANAALEWGGVVGGAFSGTGVVSAMAMLRIAGQTTGNEHERAE